MNIKLSIFLMAIALPFITNAQTSIQWEKTYGGTGIETLFKVIRTSDGGYLAACQSDSNDGDVSGNLGASDFWLVKVNVNGILEWQTCLGANDIDALNCLENDGFNGYIVAGNTVSNGEKNVSQVYANRGGQDIWAARVSQNGTLLWSQCYGGCDLEEVRTVRQTADGNFVLVGGTQSINSGEVYGAHGDWDAWVFKIDPNGVMLWQKTIGGSGIDYLYDVKETADNKLIVGGLTSSIDGDLSNNAGHGAEDYWVAQLSASGKLIWSKTYGGSSYDGIRALCLPSNGGIVVTGYTTSPDGDVTGGHGGKDIWVLRLDNTGSLIWKHAFGGSSDETSSEVLERSDNDFIMCGESSSFHGDVSGNHGGRDVWVVKFDQDGNKTGQVCLGGTSLDFGRSMVLGNTGEVVIGATTSSINGDVSANHGASDAWLVKLSVPLGLNPDVPGSDKLLDIKILPNPATDALRVVTSIPGTKQADVYNSLGQLVLSTLLNAPEETLSVGSLPSGAYTIRISFSDGQAWSAPFVKK